MPMGSSAASPWKSRTPWARWLDHSHPNFINLFFRGHFAEGAIPFLHACGVPFMAKSTAKS